MPSFLGSAPASVAARQLTEKRRKSKRWKGEGGKGITDGKRRGKEQKEEKAILGRTYMRSFTRGQRSDLTRHGTIYPFARVWCTGRQGERHRRCTPNKTRERQEAISHRRLRKCRCLLSPVPLCKLRLCFQRGRGKRKAN